LGLRSLAAEAKVSISQVGVTKKIRNAYETGVECNERLEAV